MASVKQHFLPCKPTPQGKEPPFQPSRRTAFRYRLGTLRRRLPHLTAVPAMQDDINARRERRVRREQMQTLSKPQQQRLMPLLRRPLLRKTRWTLSFIVKRGRIGCHDELQL